MPFIVVCPRIARVRSSLYFFPLITHCVFILFSAPSARRNVRATITRHVVCDDSKRQRRTAHKRRISTWSMFKYLSRFFLTDFCFSCFTDTRRWWHLSLPEALAMCGSAEHLPLHPKRRKNDENWRRTEPTIYTNPNKQIILVSFLGKHSMFVCK